MNSLKSYSWEFYIASTIYIYIYFLFFFNLVCRRISKIPCWEWLILTTYIQIHANNVLRFLFPFSLTILSSLGGPAEGNLEFTTLYGARKKGNLNRLIDIFFFLEFNFENDIQRNLLSFFFLNIPSQYKKCGLKIIKKKIRFNQHKPS